MINMERLFEKKLLYWKNKGMKKPLMVFGVRQIGKTYTVEKFAKENFDEYLYFDLEKDDGVRDIFEKTIDPEKIISDIELYIGKKINIDKTIFFFDEVQKSEQFIVSLKYFCQSDKPYKIICAGSLLGVKINRFNSSFPVGKVRMEYMYPMNFLEFLLATGNEMLADKIKECYKSMTPMPDFAHEKALLLYKKYLCVGGMPEAVSDFVENDLDVLRFDSLILGNILEMYISDMKKYVISNVESIKIEKIYRNIPAQLAKENKNFKYNFIEEKGRKRKYESSIDWLVSSKMVLITYKSKKIEIPLKAFIDEEVFKLYLSDVGLLTKINDIKYQDIISDNVFLYKGAIVENYVAQEFASKEETLYYWSSKRGAEVDFLLYSEKDGIIPIEVKAGNHIRSKSLDVYVDKHKPKYSIRFSTRNFGFENNIKSIPLYAVFCVK